MLHVAASVLNVECKRELVYGVVNATCCCQCS